MKRIWKDIPGWEGLYQASRGGQIRSLPRYKVAGRVLTPWIGKNNGYKCVTLKNVNRIQRATVHSLVMLTFVGPPPKGLEVRHLDGSKPNVKLSNLKYGTRSENAKDTVRHGHNVQAKKTHCKNGHLFDSTNTRWWGPDRKWRFCRKCHAEYTLLVYHNGRESKGGKF